MSRLKWLVAGVPFCDERVRVSDHGRRMIAVQAHNAPSPPPPTKPEDLPPGEEPAPPIETPLTPEPGNPPLDPNPERDDPDHLDPGHAP